MKTRKKAQPSPPTNDELETVWNEHIRALASAKQPDDWDAEPTREEIGEAVRQLEGKHASKAKKNTPHPYEERLRQLEDQALARTDKQGTDLVWKAIASEYRRGRGGSDSKYRKRLILAYLRARQWFTTIRHAILAKDQPPWAATLTEDPESFLKALKLYVVWCAECRGGKESARKLHKEIVILEHEPFIEDLASRKNLGDYLERQGIHLSPEQLKKIEREQRGKATTVNAAKAEVINMAALGKKGAPIKPTGAAAAARRAVRIARQVAGPLDAKVRNK